MSLPYMKRVGICRTSQYADVKEVKLGSKVITLHPVIDVDCEIIEPKVSYISMFIIIVVVGNLYLYNALLTCSET